MANVAEPILDASSAKKSWYVYSAVFRAVMMHARKYQEIDKLFRTRHTRKTTFDPALLGYSR